MSLVEQQEIGLGEENPASPTRIRQPPERSRRLVWARSSRRARRGCAPHGWVRQRSDLTSRVSISAMRTGSGPLALGEEPCARGAASTVQRGCGTKRRLLGEKAMRGRAAFDRRHRAANAPRIKSSRVDFPDRGGPTTTLPPSRCGGR